MAHVSEHYEARVQTSRERRRLSQVRKSFDAVLKQKGSGADIPLEFFSASVAYIKASMDRLHDQDQRIHDFLKPHVTAGDDQAATLENLDMRLAKSREALEALVSASSTYATEGDKGWGAFKTAVESFMEVYFKILLGGQHSTLTLQEEVFDEGIWDQVAGVTPESLALEDKLYLAVQGLAPADADPATFIGGPPAPGAGPPNQQGRPQP